MQQGVPTGAFGPLPASKQWPPAADMPDDDLAPPALLHCEGNWKRAEEHPEVLQALLAKEIEGGFVAAFDGSEEDAKARWPAGTAIGKLNIVFSDERDARLVLDSSICNLNARCTLPERMALPSALDVQLSFSPHDPLAIWRALCLDFKGCTQTHACQSQRARNPSLPRRRPALLLQSLPFWRPLQLLLVGPRRRPHHSHPARTTPRQPAPRMDLRR